MFLTFGYPYSIMITCRDAIEEVLLRSFPAIRPFNPSDSLTLRKYQDEKSFGLSNLAFALYSNGHSLRGKSSNYPRGLFYEDGESVFSLGYYRKEYDSENAQGYLMITSPRGKKCFDKVQKIMQKVQETKVPCRGVYLRFLSLELYLESLRIGFLPVKEFPWHPEAPEEDETYNHSLVDLCNLMELGAEGEIKIKLVSHFSKNSRSKARDAYSRFKNFLERNNLTYTLDSYVSSHEEKAHQILFHHFSFLKERGKAIGSTPEDHLNSLDPQIHQLEPVKAYIGYLGNYPVSLFVGEKLTPKTFALYTPFTVRDPQAVLPSFGLVPETEFAKGFTAISCYAYLRLFSELRREGIQKVHFGGSETADLNRFKRQLGATNVPSYWAVKLF
jgi:hypothetical protein